LTFTLVSLLLSLHDALPICTRASCCSRSCSSRGITAGAMFSNRGGVGATLCVATRLEHPRPLSRKDGDRRHAARARDPRRAHDRSEEHTSELQSRENLVCRL